MTVVLTASFADTSGNLTSQSGCLGACPLSGNIRLARPMGMDMNWLEEMGSTCGRDREMRRKREGFISSFNYALETQVPLEGMVVGDELGEFPLPWSWLGSPQDRQ